jgi:hypothetical protein
VHSDQRRFVGEEKEIHESLERRYVNLFTLRRSGPADLIGNMLAHVSAFFVLSPAGYYHEYATPSTPFHLPSLSLHIPMCTVHPLKTMKPQFTIEGRKAGSKGLRGSLKIKQREVAWSYRAKGMDIITEWWVELDKVRDCCIFFTLLFRLTFTPGIGVPDKTTFNQSA